MKKLLLGLLLVFSIGINAQALTKDGTYTATIVIDDEKYDYHFELYQGIVIQIDADEEDINHDTQRTLSNAATTTYSWLNARGAWSESQTFVFTKDVESGKLYVHLLRVVQNKGDEPWATAGYGEVFKN